MNIDRPFVLLKIAQSLDGYLDNSSPKRQVFSNPEDSTEVDQLRADCDAILVGAETIRKDNPRLLIRNDQLKQRRLSQGKSRYPIKVTYSKSGNIPLECNFLCLGEGQKIIYFSKEASIREDISFFADTVRADLSPAYILSDLASRGVRKLMIEGGAQTAAWFLKENLVNQIRLAIAPYFLAKNGGPNLGDPFLEKFRLKQKIVSSKNLNGMLVFNLQTS